MAHGTEPLKLTNSVLREIAQEVYRKFQTISNNISIHVDAHGVMIWIHADKDMLVLPEGPRDLRITEGHPYLTPPEH